ncbi:MAG: cytochrome c [Elusimicrobia bacterium]|nr:cytochrome c [Elusimicrobiota bacterium]
MRAALAAAALAAASLAYADDGTLTFNWSGKQVARFTKQELLAKVPPVKTTFLDPRYGKPKTYQCLPIAKVMDVAFGKDWANGAFSEAAFAALDGYVSVASAAKLTEDGGCLAIEDADVPGWEPVGRKKVSPGPFYLAWSGPEQSTEKDYPWPYQLASITLMRFAERYPEVVPQGAAAGSPSMRGYETFKANCVRCHAINQQGGKIGPDLNAPQSITAYRPKDMIKKYVKKPSQFRYTEMPDHDFLTDAQLEDLYQYFLYKSKQPERKPAK